MAWFVAAVAVLRAGIEARVFRVSGDQGGGAAQVLPAHTKTDRIDARVLARMPMVDDGLRGQRADGYARLTSDGQAIEITASAPSGIMRDSGSREAPRVLTSRQKRVPVNDLRWPMNDGMAVPP